MSRWSVQPQVQHRSTWLPVNPTKTHDVARSLPQLHFSKLMQLSSISTILPSYNPKKICRQKLKMKSNIALWNNCNQSAMVSWSTGVPHDIGGSENGSLLWTRAQRVTETQPKWPGFVGSVAREQLFCKSEPRWQKTSA